MGDKRDVENNKSRDKNWQIVKIQKSCEGQRAIGIFTTKIKLAFFFLTRVLN